MKWEYVQGDYIVFYRRKTETTRRNNLKPIEVPLNSSILSLIEKWGDKNSSYVFGLMKEGKDETYMYNKVAKIKKRINKSLKIVSKILELSLPLTIKTARETYATTLLREGVSKDEIGEMLGHSNSIVTEHYLAGLEKEKKKKINSVLPQRNSDKIFPQGLPQELLQSIGK
jgi:integrase